MNTVKLTDEQLDDVRRGIMQQAVADMEAAASEMHTLAEVAPWPDGSRSSDVQSAVRCVRESLELLDALGWPRDETRAEWEARMHATTAGES